MKRLVLAISLCGLTAGASYAQPSPQDAPLGTPARTERAKPAVKVREQPGVPLRLSWKTQWATPDQSGLEVYFEVENVGGRPVRAYSVRAGDSNEGQNDNGCLLHNIEKPGKILRPGQTVGRSTWRLVSHDEAPPTIDLEIDYVEFTDGGVWGADTCQTAERLGGLREGARVAKARFKRRLSEKGADTLIKTLYSDDPDLATPEGRSEAWNAGFRGAINSLRERIRQADEEGGEPEIHAALNRPFDASENP